MRVVDYMDLNGVMQGENRLQRWFILPDKKNSRRSLRFGAHAFALKATMQILPVGDYGRRPRPAGRGSIGQEQTRKFIKKILNELNVRSLLM